MNKKLNRRIIVAGVIALLFIWVCLAFNNIDWAMLYAWILIGGGICVLVATNIIILAAKNGENEMFEPKITKAELVELYRQNQAVVRLEDLQKALGGKKRVACSQDVSKVLEKMGFTINGVEGNYIYFKDNNNKYSLFTQWIHSYQTNYLGLYTEYNVNAEDVDLFTRLAADITDHFRIVKMTVCENGNDKSLCITADTFYSGEEQLQNVIVPLVDMAEKALDSFVALKEQTASNSVSEISEKELSGNKAKYSC